MCFVARVVLANDCMIVDGFSCAVHHHGDPDPAGDRLVQAIDEREQNKTAADAGAPGWIAAAAWCCRIPLRC